MTTLVKLNNNVPVFNSFFDDFLRRDLHAGFIPNKVATNVKETKEGYQLELIIPGFKKEQIAIQVENQHLKIQGNVDSEREQKAEEKYTIREFQKAAFEKSYKLPSDVDTEKISAKHEDGILNIWVPKKAKEEVKVKNIEIAS